jgi:hypothetical protein
MIPILKDFLSVKYNTKYFTDEFNSGNGIADLVYTTKVKENKNLFLDYDLIHILYTYFNRINKKINIKDFISTIFLSKKKALELIQSLLDSGYIEQIDEDTFLIKKKYDSPLKDIISIEAKLSDWKGGFYQALRYKAYSNKSFLAISKQFIHRVDKKLLKDHDIGLISVSPDEVKIIINPIISKPKNKVAHTYLADKLYFEVINN